MKMQSLRRRILLAFIASSALAASLFGLSTIIFAYHTEDQVFETFLKAEASYVEQQLASDTLVTPRLTFASYYKEISALPQPIQTSLLHAPTRNEFALDGGRHFHLFRLSKGFLLADVTEQLVVRQMRQQLAVFLFTLLLIVVLCSAGFAYLLARRVLKPLHQLTRVVDSTGQQSAMPLTASFANDFSPDEIGRLAQALQKSWQRVAEFIGREQQFTQDVSHELRTPLTVVQGALTLIQHSPLTTQQILLVQRLQSAQLQINQTIETLMLLAREQLPAAAPVKLLPLVEQSILQQQAKLDGKTVKLQLDISVQSQLTMDENSLLILLNNLIGNAFEHTTSGVIGITFQHQVLTVQDSGSGIDASIREQVFESGVKGQSSQGMGVGLSLVKRLCDKWQILYQLHSNNQGTCVRLQFPD
ncbi:HAMP domain-containing sensor histidine kinase [Rheinheimera baltica]|uniref:histidine kinase n=1 Tax=Rheinheimera baltica TaxID=67576 RepID=A0ABT9I691_9GAMM|nr:HAMP domain-containing sensor histidine kinase [Rheinheimera baltica]MDP5138481.1 HAMP domain-containing sensor histidine kinase [Rheinheimera baltica]MDP5150597.1 HAMP domain-containing sensor histidine kinase [Rheinheimera baltica]